MNLIRTDISFYRDEFHRLAYHNLADWLKWGASRVERKIEGQGHVVGDDDVADFEPSIPVIRSQIFENLKCKY